VWYSKDVQRHVAYQISMGKTCNGSCMGNSHGAL
jgi:hypothetical protein